jgi:hypothetical protein
MQARVSVGRLLLLSFLALAAPQALAGDAPGEPRATLLFFWRHGCPHCEEAKPFVRDLARERPELEVRWIDVRGEPADRELFLATMRRLEVQAAGVPTFVIGDQLVVGFLPGSTEREVRALVDAALAGSAAVAPAPVILPLVGALDPASLPLLSFTLIVGLVDGINPCAIWVLLVLLGILMRVRSTTRLALVGGIFVVMSGVVYAIFMTAWLAVFQLVGLSRAITMALGAVVVVMALINLKETVWFRQGPSLTIPDRVKPSLYRRMRAVAQTVQLPAMIVGVAALAFVVNLVELACTIGLPAMYTRVLSLRSELSGAARLAYIGLYNVAYVVPLALVVVVYTLTLHRLVLDERGAKILKAVSGVILLVAGLALLFTA